MEIVRFIEALKILVTIEFWQKEEDIYTKRYNVVYFNNETIVSSISNFMI